MAPFPRPTFAFEAAALAAGAGCVAGVDEVGRGSLAGPVVAAAVILDPARIPPGIDDSKRLAPRTRERLDRLVRESATVALGEASADEVDALNVLRATHLAMARALAALPGRPGHVLVDGRQVPPGLAFPMQGIVGGDRLSLSVAAASIVAKVWRDRIMVDLAQRHPGYGWESNKGYGSESHIRALHVLGISPIHRRTFAPVHKLLWQGASSPPAPH